MIVAASTIGTRQRAWLAHPPVPVVLVNTGAGHVDLPSVASDSRAGGRLAARHLLELGHRRFGYLIPPRNVDAPNRVAGVQDELTGHDREHPTGEQTSLALGNGGPTVAGGEAAMDELLAAPVRPTAVVAYNDLMAIGALRAIRRAGLRVPDDVSIVGFDDVAFAEYAEPALTTVHQETAEMGRWAVARLTERFSGHPTTEPTPRIVLPVRLAVRASTGPAPSESHTN
jgi:DNA-binding LacI/PurR family transcriptional regulator